MGNALQWSLDVATALSIISAAVAFMLQQSRQKKADREDAKWALLRESADKVGEYKSQIVQEVLRVDSFIKNDNKDIEERNEKLESLRTVARTALSSAIYYALYDLRLKAEAITRHYDGAGLENMPVKIESFVRSMSDVLDRLRVAEKASAELNAPIAYYYVEHFLREVGFRYRSDPPDYQGPMGEELDEAAEEYRNRGYTPRRYIKKEDQPPTAFEVIDGFFDSMLSKQ
ncbi:MAG: hypothetical protein OXC70_05150 [Gammaproteobacteria bacterium]|nr:hypothetical protein [Gammaproteobacteria bacterium]